MIKKNEQKTSTVFIRGLPAFVKDSTLTENFKGYGKIRQAFVTKPKANSYTDTQIGYVKFTTIEEATSAIECVKTIGDTKVILSYARKKPRKYRKPVQQGEQKHDNSGLSDTDDEDKNVEPNPKNTIVKKDDCGAEDDCGKSKDNNYVQETKMSSDNSNNENTFPKNARTIYIQNLLEGLSENHIKKKCRKAGAVESVILNGTTASVTFKDENSVKVALKKLNNHVFKQKVITAVSSMLSAKAMTKRTTPSRIMIRNLSFKVTEELLKTELLAYGKILDLSIPKNENGKIKGFAFVSYINKFEANKALQKLNGKEFFGRKVAVDWAVSKDQYIKSEPSQNVDNQNDDQDGQEEEYKDGENDESDEEVHEDDCNKNIDDSNTEAVEGQSEDEEEEESHKPKREYDDVKEGRTIFMGNLPFDIEKEDIEDTFSVYGSIRYVRMVYDKEKDRPKGIAFLQFKEKSDAESCLERVKVQPICIAGRTIAVSRAVDSKHMNLTGDKATIKTGKDNRNLHLAMEGVIKEGTNAASGVSKADMMKRKLALEAKKKKLKNINFFVATDRLCVRNMPSTFSETELKKLMSKYGHVTQVKIMRDIKQASSEGIGKSKGYGFVQFSKQEAALAALRGTNNNPSIFTPVKRPIVDFAVENGKLLTARAKKGLLKNDIGDTGKSKKSFNQRWKENREKKKEKSNLKTPNKLLDSPTSQKPIEVKKGNDKGSKRKRKKQNKKPTENLANEPLIKSDPQPKPQNPSNPTDAPTSQIKSNKRGKKGKSERPNKKQKREKEQVEEKTFQKLVQNYKGKLQSGEQARSFKKWYDD